MLNSIITFSVKNKLLTGLMVCVLIIIGAYQATRLPIDAVPDITNNQVQVITVAPSFGAADIERLVTFPIEQSCSNISGTSEIRSFSRFGLSLVTIVFKDDIDIYWARQQVAEKLQQAQAQIPLGIGTPVLGPISTGLGEIYQYVVRPKKGYARKYDATALRTIQDWIVRRQLLGVKGVAEVSSFGGRLKQYEIAVDPDKLNAHGITINDVFSALETNNQNTGGAYIEKGPAVLFIRTEGLLKTSADIESIAIPRPVGQLPLFIRDVATVTIGHAPRYGALCYNDEGEVAGAVVMMLKGANSSEVIKNVKQRIEQIQQTLPEGVVIEPFLDRTKMVNHAIGTVEKNLMEGALIVVFVLVLFLGNIRAGLLVASVIPLSMLFAICMMNLFGVSGNLMSLGALDFGLIVDGAVIIVESVMHYLSHNGKYQQSTGLSQQQMDNMVNQSAQKMMNSAVFGQIIILIVYLPIFTLQGIEGKMFKPMAQTVAFALLGAFLLSLTYIPMMSSLVLSRKTHQKKNLSDKMMRYLEALFTRNLLWVLRRPLAILLPVALMFVVSIGVLMKLGGEFIPALEEGDFAVDTRVLKGSNLNTTIEFTQKAAHILKERFPEVEKVVTKIGSGEVPTDPMPMEASDLMVILKDKSHWVSATSFPELEEKMSKALAEVPGITTGFQFPVQMRFNELMTGARQDVVCKIFGENLDTLALYAEKLANIIATTKGTENLYVEPINGMPQVVIEYKRPQLAQYHLSVADVNRVVNMAFAGQNAGQMFEDEKRFDVVVRLSNEKKQNVDAIKNLLVPMPSGLQVPLYQLADISIKNGVNQIQREDTRRRIVVGFNVSGRDVESIVQELRQKVNAQLKFPVGYYVTYGGAFENLEQAKGRLMVAVPLALLLIFILLYFAFRNVRQGLIIYTAIPLSAIGGILSLAIRGMPFSISAGVGFIALFGVAVLNGIVLIAEFNRLRKLGVQSLATVVIKGTRLRLRPVLMTALVASLGFLPMALSQGAGAEVQRPLATVVIGGLLIATLLTLFVLPLLYIIFEKGFKIKRMKKVPLAILVLFVTSASAQTTINLQAALDTAVKNNLQIRNTNLQATYARQMIATAWDIPKTNIIAEAGQINSALIDTRISLSQTMAFPVVYRRQQDVYEAEYNKSIIGTAFKSWEIKKAVTLTFSQYQLLKHREMLLMHADSLFTAFYEKALLRLKQGETNVLEKATAENQRAAIGLQLVQLRQEQEAVLAQFRYLLNTATHFTPLVATAPYQLTLTAAALEQNPLLKTAAAQVEVEQANEALAKARLKPDILMGINSTSFNGVGADNKSYTAANRFFSAQLGLGIPLFAKSQKAKVKAAQIATELAMASLTASRQQLEATKQQLSITLQGQQKAVAYYQSTGLGNAKLIRETAARQFNEGEINYLSYVMLLNQAISIESNYLDAVQYVNHTIVQLNYLTN